MNRIISFEDFKSSKNVGESPDFNSTTNEGHDEMTNYMFFQNLASIKHYIEEIMSMDKKSIDAMISDGHDWAVDHVATSKDDIEEVAGWLRNSMSNQEGEEEEEEIISLEEPLEPEDDDDDDEEEEIEYKSEMVYEESEEEESEQ